MSAISQASLVWLCEGQFVLKPQHSLRFVSCHFALMRPSTQDRFFFFNGWDNNTYIRIGHMFNILPVTMPVAGQVTIILQAV